MSSLDSFGTIGGKVLSQSRICTQDFLGQSIDGRSIMLHSKQGNLISVLEGFIGWPTTPTLMVAYFVDAFMLWIQLLCPFILQFVQYWFAWVKSTIAIDFPLFSSWFVGRMVCILYDLFLPKFHQLPCAQLKCFSSY